MIADLEPYPEYRESGLPWLDAVPKHWVMVPNRALMQDQRKVVGENATDYTLLSLTLRGIIPRDMDNPKGKFPAQFNTYKVVRPEDLVFCLFDIDETPRGVGHSKLKGMITGAYDVFSPRRSVNPRFLYLYYFFVDEGKLLKPLYTGLRKTIQRGVFASLKAPLPPPAEQAAIVRFLDWANGRLERAIRAKRKVILLLNEQKQAIIHRAVTRGLPAEAAAKAGLDPSVPLKPSGIPWLGDIPPDWEVRKLKFLVSTVGGMTPNKSVARFWEGQVPWVSPKDMKVREIADSQDHITDAALRETGVCLIQPPAVLMVVRGMILARTFPTAVTTVPVTVNQDMKGLIPSPELNAYFLASMLTGIQHELLSLVDEAGHGTKCLRTESWANFSVPLPPIREQIRINEELKSQLVGVNTAISRLEREIELLREYRTRLVADVVTGKLDVREAAARLPDDGVTLEPDYAEATVDGDEVAEDDLHGEIAEAEV